LLRTLDLSLLLMLSFLFLNSTCIVFLFSGVNIFFYNLPVCIFITYLSPETAVYEQTCYFVIIMITLPHKDGCHVSFVYSTIRLRYIHDLF
jgi:hypothetical protein